MAAGFGLLRLSPPAFWAMTPREFASAVRWMMPTDPALTRNTLSALMRQFPDA
jgi:uncharacterized phage protein (TIGR02216 family)